MTTVNIPKSYALNIRVENLVRAFIGGLNRNVTSADTIALRDMQDVSDLAPVTIGKFNAATGEVYLDSDIRSAVALQGVRAQLVLDVLMAMEFANEEDDTTQPVVVVDFKSKDVVSPAVTHLGAVYHACSMVLHSKCMRDAALSTKTTTKRKGN